MKIIKKNLFPEYFTTIELKISTTYPYRAVQFSDCIDEMELYMYVVKRFTKNYTSYLYRSKIWNQIHHILSYYSM